MAEWRFGLSIIFAMFGVILVGCGFYAIGDMTIMFPFVLIF